MFELSGRAMEKAATNGQGDPVAVVQGSAVGLPTLLGRAAPRVPVAGRIRAGIKVLTRRAVENERVRAIYERGVAQGKSFDSIEREIADAVPELKNPLTPKNVPYFTVRGEDFPNPEIARQIMDLFGEDRVDGVKRLYRFPVVFPADAWQSVMPHELVAWTANERRFWSEYAPDGQTRHCMTHAPVPLISGTHRVMVAAADFAPVLAFPNLTVAVFFAPLTAPWPPSGAPPSSWPRRVRAAASRR